MENKAKCQCLLKHWHDNWLGNNKNNNIFGGKKESLFLQGGITVNNTFDLDLKRCDSSILV